MIMVVVLNHQVWVFVVLAALLAMRGRIRGGWSTVRSNRHGWVGGYSQTRSAEEFALLFTAIMRSAGLQE